MPQWNIDTQRMYTSIDCNSANSVDEIRTHLESCNIRCHSDQNRVIIEQPNNWLEIVDASEPFIGACLTSSNQRLTATDETLHNSERGRRRVVRREEREKYGL